MQTLEKIMGAVLIIGALFIAGTTVLLAIATILHAAQ